VGLKWDYGVAYDYKYKTFQTYPRGVEVDHLGDRVEELFGFRRTLVGLKCRRRG